MKLSLRIHSQKEVNNFDFAQKLWSDMDILQIENFRNGFLESDLKVKRSNRTTFVVYGTVAVTDDVSNNDVNPKIWFSERLLKISLYFVDGNEFLLQFSRQQSVRSLAVQKSKEADVLLCR